MFSICACTSALLWRHKLCAVRMRNANVRNDLNCRCKCKKGKGWPLPLVHSRKLTKTTISPALFPAVTVTVVRGRKIRTALRTSQIAGFVTVPSWEKINKDTKDDVFDDFPKIFDHFPKISEDFSIFFQRPDEPFRTFSEDNWRLPNIAEDDRGRSEDVSIIHQQIYV